MGFILNITKYGRIIYFVIFIRFIRFFIINY